MINDSDSEITRMLPMVFDNFPLFDENHRVELEKKIVKHYYFREIGYETWGQFRFRFNQKLQEIMPFYNERYKSLTFEYDPLKPTDMITDNTNEVLTENTTNGENHSTGSQQGSQNTKGTQTTKGSQTTNGTNTSNGTQSTENSSETSTQNNRKYWDTPQTELGEQSYATNINVEQGSSNTTGNSTTETSNTDVTESETSSNQTTESESNTTTEQSDRQDATNSQNSNGKQNTTGQTKSYGNAGIPNQDLVQKYRDVIINVDLEIIYALNECFMGVY